MLEDDNPDWEKWYDLGWRPLPAESEWKSLGSVLRPHILYGPIVAYFYEFEHGPKRWVLTTLGNWFPDDAFEPYWMPLPEMPWRRDNVHT